MNKTALRYLTLLIIGGSFWLAPMAQASECSYTDPSKYIPVLRLPAPTNHPAFVVQEKAGQLEVRNTAARTIYVLMTKTTPENVKQKIIARNPLTIDLENAHHYLENTPSIGSDCNSDGGVPAGRPVPQNIHTLLVLDLTVETVAVPIEIAFVENPNYAADLAEYQRYQKQEQGYRNFYKIAGVIYILGCAFLGVAAIVVIGLFLRFLRDVT
jgi:hypothetical protein